MKFDLVAFKIMVTIALAVFFIFVLVALPACFNTPKSGSPNMANGMISIVAFFAVAIILIIKYT